MSGTASCTVLLGGASILDFANAMPGGVRSVQQMSISSGLPLDQIRRITHCDEIPVLAEGETVLGLGVRAARQLQARQPERFTSIDQVIVAGGGYWDHPFWSPSSALAAQLGIEGAHCFEVINFCSSSTTGLRLALDAVAGSGSRLTLLVLGDQLSRVVDLSDPEARELFNYGDAATALLVGAGPGLFRIEDAVSVSDPSWSGFYRGEYDAKGRVLVRNAETRDGLGARYVEAFDQLAEQVFTRNGLTAADIELFLINHGDRRMHENVLSRLGIPTDRSWFRYHLMGHMGASDPFLALEEAVAGGRLEEGDAVLIASSGLGFTWGMTLLRVGSCAS